MNTNRVYNEWKCYADAVAADGTILERIEIKDFDDEAPAEALLNRHHGAHVSMFKTPYESTMLQVGDRVRCIPVLGTAS